MDEEGWKFRCLGGLVVGSQPPLPPETHCEAEQLRLVSAKLDAIGRFNVRLVDGG